MDGDKFKEIRDRIASTIVMSMCCEEDIDTNPGRYELEQAQEWIDDIIRIYESSKGVSNG